jgi:putative hydrolase
VTDNLFDRLADLFRESGPVNWRLAREIAESVAGPAQPVDPWTDEELRDLASTAQRLVSAGSPLDPLAAGAEVRTLGRRDWATANVEAFAYLAEPLAERLAGTGIGLPAALQPLGPALLGMQMGATIGFLSHRVLGQFDAGLAAGEPTPITFVAEKMAALASEHALDERQLRLWVALQEVTHHTILAVPWVHEHLLMLAHGHVEGLDLDPESISQRLEMLQDPEAVQRMMEGAGGFTGFEAPVASSDTLDRIKAFMAMVEGYGDYLIEHSASEYLPDLSGIRRAADEARAGTADNERMLHQVMGIALDPHQNRAGASFCAEVARRWGEDALNHIWEGPDMMPSLEELEDATGWAARVLL